jgi:DNA-binding NtrC family response regulator
VYAYPKVIVVSSDRETYLLTEALGRFAFVTKVESIPEALALVEAGDYDALFCDRKLDQENWRTVLEELNRRRQEIPVIVFCHCGGEREWIEALQAGAFDFLAPPYRSNQILALMERAQACSHKEKDCCQSV